MNFIDIKMHGTTIKKKCMTSVIRHECNILCPNMCSNISSPEINPGVTFQALRVHAANEKFCTSYRVCNNRTHPSPEPDQLSTSFTPIFFKDPF